jgi:phage recombination protein Bet
MSNAVVHAQPRSVLIDMATRFGMEPAAFEQVLRATVVPGQCSKEQFAAFLLVAKQYNLNPITKEIYAFPAKGGGIQPIVGIDGWMRIMNDHDQFDGMEFEDLRNKDDQVIAIACRIFRKDRNHPVLVTEYLSECKRDTDPWKKWPARMLRHKAAIQCARYAFGFSGIIDPDEYERGVGAGFKNTMGGHIVPPTPPRDYQQRIADAAILGTTTAEQFEDTKPVPLAKIKEQLKASLVEIDKETGEIVDPDESTTLKVKGKKAKAKETEIDPDKYLDDLQGKIAVAKTPDDLAEIWSEHLAYADQLLPPDRELAESYLEERRARLEKGNVR